jgi:hypothetical protein
MLTTEFKKATRDNFVRRFSSPLHMPVTDNAAEDDETAAFQRLVADAFPHVREKLLRVQPVATHVPVVTKDETRWCLVCTRDGEWPELTTFRTAEQLATQLQRLEGHDVTVHCFYGLPLSITKGPQRYIKLPSGELLTVPLYAGVPCERHHVSELTDLEYETTGFMGPPELASPVKPEETDEETDD